MPEKPSCRSAACLDRRGMLLTGGLAISQTVLGTLFPGRVLAQAADRSVQLSTYPQRKIARLESLQLDRPVLFSYPKPAIHTHCALVRLPTRAGGGVGPDQSVVEVLALWHTKRGESPRV